jgi:hypothetical protein
MFRKWFSGAAVAGLVLGSVVLGIAAPAEAFAPPPVKPKPPHALSSELQDAGTQAVGSNPAPGAAALAGARLASTGGIPAFNPAVQVLRGNFIAAAFEGVGMLGQGAGKQFGVDYSGTLCSWANSHPGDLAVQAGYTDEMAGRPCNGSDGQQITNTIPKAAQNSDAVGMPAGFLVTTSKAGTGVETWAGPTGQTPAQTAAFSWTVTASGQSAGTYLNYDALCTDGNAAHALQQVYISAQEWGNAGASGTMTANCPTGTTVLAFGRAITHTDNAPLVSTSLGTWGGQQYWIETGGTIVAWVSSTSTLWKPATTNNPDRFDECQIMGSDGHIYSADGPTYKETDVKPATVCPTLPKGISAGWMDVFQHGGPQVLDLTGQIPTTQAYKNAVSAYPLCADNSCELHLYDSKGDCEMGDSSRCASWFTDPNKSTDYSCHYGSYTTASLSECNVLAPYYDPQKVAAGQAFADPATGSPPDPGVQTSPQPAPPPAPSDPTTPCFPSGWGAMNPVNWVLMPVQCALQWAFVPRTSVVNGDVTGMENQWSTKMPAQIAGVISGAVFIPPSSSGCNGITVPIDWLTKKPNDTMQVMNACPGSPLAPLPPWSRIIGDVVFTVLGALAITRYIAGVVGFTGLGKAQGGD